MTRPFIIKQPGPSRWPDKVPKRKGPKDILRGDVWKSERWIGTVRAVRDGRPDMLWVESSYWERRADWERGGRKGHQPRRQREVEVLHGSWPPNDPDERVTERVARGKPEQQVAPEEDGE